MSETKQPRMPKVWEALIPVVAIMVFMIVGTVSWGMDPHIPLVLACVVTAFVAAACGYKWDAIITGALDSVKSAVETPHHLMCRYAHRLMGMGRNNAGNGILRS